MQAPIRQQDQPTRIQLFPETARPQKNRAARQAFVVGPRTKIESVRNRAIRSIQTD
jgi:hypothetical protein